MSVVVRNEAERKIIVCIGVSTPLKNTPPLSCQAPLLNLQIAQAPLFRQSPPVTSLLVTMITSQYNSMI